MDAKGGTELLAAAACGGSVCRRPSPASAACEDSAPAEAIDELPCVIIWLLAESSALVCSYDLSISSWEVQPRVIRGMIYGVSLAIQGF